MKMPESGFPTEGDNQIPELPDTAENTILQRRLCFENFKGYLKTTPIDAGCGIPES